VKIKQAESPGTRNQSTQAVTERVYAGLRSNIIIGALRLEQAFSEKDLADQYQTSRTPVREAAVRLQVEGLGSIIPNRGYFVTNLTIKEMNDLYAYRAAVESACVELLCDARLQPKAMASLGEVACFRADSDGKFADFIRADTDFHVGLARLSNNMLMLRTIAQLRSLTERISFAAEEAIEVRYYGEVPANNTRRFCKLFVATVPNSLVA